MIPGELFSTEIHLVVFVNEIKSQMLRKYFKEVIHYYCFHGLSGREKRRVQAMNCVIDLIDQKMCALQKGLFLQNIVDLD